MEYSKKLTARILVAVATFVVLACMNAAAQKSFVGKFTVEEELHWDKAVLPAGEYVLTVESMQSPVRVIVRGVDGKSSALLNANFINQSESGRPFLLTTRDGANLQMRYLNLPAVGVSLVYKPLSKQERLQQKEARLASLAVKVSSD